MVLRDGKVAFDGTARELAADGPIRICEEFVSG